MRRSIGRDNAVKMFQREWWVGKRYKDIALIGLSLRELTLPLTILHLAVENSLGKVINPKQIEENAETILASLLHGMPPLTLKQIHDIAFSGKRNEVIG